MVPSFSHSHRRHCLPAGFCRNLGEFVGIYSGISTQLNFCPCVVLQNFCAGPSVKPIKAWGHFTFSYPMVSASVHKGVFPIISSGLQMSIPCTSYHVIPSKWLQLMLFASFREVKMMPWAACRLSAWGECCHLISRSEPVAFIRCLWRRISVYFLLSVNIWRSSA